MASSGSRPATRSSASTRTGCSGAERRPPSARPATAATGSGGGRGRRGFRTVADPAQRPVDLREVRLSFATVLQPGEVARVDPGDLADRPVDVAPEWQDRPGRATRRRTGAT